MQAGSPKVHLQAPTRLCSFPKRSAVASRDPQKGIPILHPSVDSLVRTEATIKVAEDADGLQGNGGMLVYMAMAELAVLHAGSMKLLATVE